MTRRVCGAFRQGGILIALLGLLLNMGRSAFAADVFQIEWVVVQGIACVDANGNATCSPNEVAVPKVQVRSDGTVLATTDSTGRFSVRVPAQTVIEFELPAGYESATGELITQVFESGRLDVPLTQQVVATATAVKPAGTAIKPTATTRAKATATVVATATKQNTPTPTLTVTPEPSPAKVPPTLTASAIPPTEAPSTETPAATEAAATRQTLATATATLAPTETALPQPTETITTLVVIAAGDVPTAPPDVSATPINASPAPLPSFEEEAQSASQSGPEFSLGAIPQAYVVSGGFLLGLGLLIGLFVYRSNALKTNGLAAASAGGSFAAGSPAVMWDQGSSQHILQTPQVQQTPHTPIFAIGREWHPTAQRLLNHAHLKTISIDAEAGILAATTVPAPVFVLGGLDGYRLVFTIDPSLPVRSGLVADRSQVSRVARFTGASRGDAHNLWKQVAQSRNLANPVCPVWADWYLLVCQRINQAG